MSKKAQLLGQRFGRLVVEAESGSDGNVLWQCRCDCGNVVVVHTTVLTTGAKKSCNCLHRRHGGYQNGEPTKEYATWTSIKQRCHNPSNIAYPQYGGQGVTVCEEWRKSFKAFFEHMGPAPSSKHSIHRLDGTRGYEPGNCVWATAREQGANRKNSRMLNFDGESITVAEAARRLNFSYSTLQHRLDTYGWDLAKAIRVPKRAYTFVERPTSLGESKTPEYRAWLGMRNRCHNPNAVGYRNYGGAGIRVCARWNKYENFLADMGRRPSEDLSLEREDPFGDYEPKQCHWGTPKEQANNKTNTRFFECNGERLTLRGWSDKSGLSYSLLKSRLQNGWTIERAISTSCCAPNFNAQRYIHDGQFLTLHEWSEQVKIPVCTLQYRLHAGWTFGKAVTTTPSHTTKRGPSKHAIKYSLNREALTIQEWATRLGVHKSTIQHRIRAGWSLERALLSAKTESGVTSKSRAKRWINYDHVSMTLVEAALKYGLKPHTLAKRLTSGWSVKDALTAPVGGG